MKRIYFSIIMIISIALFTISCNKEETIRCFADIGGVDIYLLESYETLEPSCQINEETATTKENAFIKYSDLLSYNSTKYSFTISEAVKEKLMDIQFPVSGIAFGVKVNNELVYTGYFWPGYSSQICTWTTIDPLYLYSGNELMVTLGYPGQLLNTTITDKRNDSRILNVFRRDGKLIE
jgi:hypothetical protein